MVNELDLDNDLAFTIRRLRLADAKLRLLREWIARARAQSLLVELPSGPAVLVPGWFMQDEEFVETPVDITAQ